MKGSFAAVEQPIEITGSLSLSYAGFGRTPGYSVNSAGSLSFLYTDNITGLSLGSTAPKNIGNYKVKITLIDGPDVGFFVETNYTIIKRLLSITSVTNTKNYDGTITASGLPTITSGSLGAGDVGTFKEEYDTKNQGTGKTLTPSVVSIVDGGGFDMTGNYTVTLVATTNGTINKKPLTITATAGQTKVYGVTDPTSYAYTLSAPLLGSDVLTGALTRVSGETVGPYAIQQGTLTNANYDITYVSNNFTITTAPLSITGITGANKIYDGTIIVTITGTASYVGLVAADAGLAVTGSPSFSFNNKNVGTAKPITVSGYTAPSSNYTLTQPTGLTGDITPKTVNVFATANDKQYDGNTTATLSNITSPGFISGDLVTINHASATFDTKEVGNNKTVTVTGINLTNTDAPNYQLVSNTVTTLANITAPPVFIFELPNAFTPNGDGKNDELKVISNAGVTELKSFKIFSRSGNLVFESRDLSRGWDGRYNGNMLPSDIYYWTAVYVDRNNVTNSKTGTVLLLK